jgi:hypothetical protein
MQALDSGPSTEVAPEPGPATSPGLPRWGTLAVICAVVLISVLLTITFHWAFLARQRAAASTNEASRPASASETKDHSLESLGSLTASHLYMVYLNIGLLADARESDVYTAADAEKVLGSVTRMLDTVDRRLAQLVADGLKDEDREAVENARHLGDLLRTQARELRAYWQTGDKEHADKFHKARQKSWSGIQEVLGIEE